MLRLNVSDGVHVMTHAYVNSYLIEDQGGLTLVDAGLPSMWPILLELLETIGRPIDDIEAMVHTHGHFDHVGIAARLRRDHHVRVYVHVHDAELAAHPYRYTPQRNRLLYPFYRPRSLPVLGRMALAGALHVRGVTASRSFAHSEQLQVPGGPIPRHTPGHTAGHCMLELPGRDTMITGDALVTLDPYTGKTGPQIVASAATQDTSQAIESLKILEAYPMTTLLPGHGMPWQLGTPTALRHARAVGEH